MAQLSESILEEAALDWLRPLGYNVIHGPDMPPGPYSLRDSYEDVLFPGTVRGALKRINPDIPGEAIDDAFRRLTRPEGSTLEVRNRNVHRMLVDGVNVEYRKNGAIRGAQVQVIDFDNPEINDWLAVNQFTAVENKHNRRFLSLVRDFIVFEDDGSGELVKKMAGYHQFHAVVTAVTETLRAAGLQQQPVGWSEDQGRYESGREPGGDPGDRRIGVVWHTQGSGKSLTMAFFAGRIIRESRMMNPTIVVLTDRNDLDDQLFSTFALCQDLLRQPPVQAESRADLRSRLAVQSGGVVFTTIQKFFPEEKGDRRPLLSDRRNIVVIADEAHRSQYAFIDGFARHMRDALPSASFIGFTGTPIELQDANTRAVFGNYISVYDIQRAVQDRATAPIYYESRLARLMLDEEEKPNLDLDFEEATEGEEIERKEKLKTRWAQLEAVVGSEERVALIAKDIVSHFEQRLEIMDGKAMIVCMSRRICVELYRALVVLRPDWQHDDDGKGQIKIVMTGSATDPPGWQTHIRAKGGRERICPSAIWQSSYCKNC